MKKSLISLILVLFSSSCSYSLSQKNISSLSDYNLCVHYTDSNISVGSKHDIANELGGRGIHCKQSFPELSDNNSHSLKNRDLSNLIVDFGHSLGRIFTPY